MLELIRRSQAPAEAVEKAAQGALDLPPAEMIEILVYLTRHGSVGAQAARTLAGFDPAACRSLCSNPDAPADVLAYFLQPRNAQPGALAGLLENPKVGAEQVVALAAAVSAQAAEALLESERVLTSEAALRALSSNPNLSIEQLDRVGAAIVALRPAPKTAAAAAAAPPPVAAPPAAEPPASSAIEEISAEALRFLEEHAAEIAATEHEPFRLVGGAEEEAAPATETEAAPATAQPEHAAAEVGVNLAVLAMRQTGDKSLERESVLQKIAKLTVGQRVQLAMKGSKDERFVLIRDGNKVVSLAVLESPKVSDSEVEGFAAMKNVQEGVLRAIASKRKFMKNYNVVRALANNPRCPLDVSLTLIKMLMGPDLHALSKNKNVSETLRKVAFKQFQEKSARK